MRILLIVHGYPPDASGGTEVYTHDLARALSAQEPDQVFVLTRDADPSRPEYDVRREVRDGVRITRINNTFRGCSSLEESYANPALLDVAETIVDEVRADVAHIQHLTCLSTGLPRAIAARGTPVVMTLNDYWLLCHRGQLFDLDWHRCNGPGAGCARCIPASMAASPPGSFRAARAVRAWPIPGAAAAVRLAAGIVDRLGSPGRAQRASELRLAHMRRAVADVDLFLAPSQTMADAFSAFGIPAHRLVRCGQGIDRSGFMPSPRLREDVLRLGFAGSLLPSKAPHLLLEAAARLPSGTVTVDLLGEGTSYHGDDSYKDTLAPLVAQPFVRQHGAAPHADVPRLLAAMDALVVPSVWIENAPFVIKEAFAAGVPVVASALGGMAELVQHEVNGLLFAPGDSSSLAGQLRRLQVEPDLLERLRAGITPPMTIEQDAADLRRQYARLISDKDARGPAARLSSGVEPEHAAAGKAVTAIVLNYRTPEQTWLAVRSLQTSFDPPSSIVVVDNGSLDGSAAALRTMLNNPSASVEVTLIETGRNLGFPAGCNVGIEAALKEGAEWVLLLNSDVVLAPDALPQLLAAARAHASAGILGPLILSREEPDLISSAGISYSVASGRMRNRLTGQPASAAPKATLDVPAVSGCAMLISCAALERAGLFDSTYFFSFEDVDFCLRARSAGFQTLCVPDARAYHEGGRTIGQRSARRVYFATRNHLKLASGLESSRLRRTLRAGAIVGLNTAYVLTSPDAPLVSGLAAVVRGTWHHLLGRYGPDTPA
jgi:GT2 family glycosyltransferase/glycosyltransferase involved in cell wall biosynthesis